VTTAIVYVDADVAIDQNYAHKCYRQVERRGYEFGALLRDWTHVDGMLTAGQASAVLFVEPDRVADLKTRDLSEYRRTGCDEPTVRLPTREEVAAALEGRAEPPCGIDPATIAAARRIARMLHDRRRAA
jgi:hypothetical protein